MAEAAAQSLQETIRQVLLYHSHMLLGVKDQVEILENHLRLFTAFLYDSSSHKEERPFSDELELQIKDVVYEIEDVFDSLIAKSGRYKKANNYLRRLLHGPAADLDPVVEDVEAIKKRILYITNKVKSDAYPKSKEKSASSPPRGFYLSSSAVTEKGKLGEYEIEEVDPIKGSSSSSVQWDAGCFDEEAKTIMHYLRQQELDIMTIVGMPGVGKTALAAKIYHDPKIQLEFPIRIWIDVTNEYRKKEVFIRILQRLQSVYTNDMSGMAEHEITQTNDMSLMADHEITQMIGKEMERTARFLIVLDNVWSPEPLIDIHEALPINGSNGKILVTSQNEKVARVGNLGGDPYKLRFLSLDESWFLLQKKVFGESQCPPGLEIFGKLISSYCRGHPLAITIASKFLRSEAEAKGIIELEDAWRMVSENIFIYLNQDPNLRDIIFLSYSQLPHYLRQCFLYLGMFPRGYEISVWTLVRLWIAEGLIEQKDGITLEQTAQHYLEELTCRSLVMIDKMSTDGEIKSCRLHPVLGEFCKSESDPQKENLFQHFKGSGAKGTLGRRLSIHSTTMNHISLDRSHPRIRSALYFAEGDQTLLPTKQVSPIPKAFKLLKVLHAESITFTKFPSDLTKMVLLRYVVLSVTFEAIPKAITGLWNLETLVVYTTLQTLTFKANILGMIRLRHVKTNATTKLPGTHEVGVRSNLQTLGSISPKSCTKDLLRGACNLKKLGIFGPFVELLKAKGLNRLQKLQKLKVVNDTYDGGILPGFPPTYKFPPNLRSLTLCATQMEWNCMSTLAMLDTLEVLKLKKKAFTGPYWEASTCGFRSLEILCIEDLDIVVWVAKADEFPRLKYLALNKCEKLKELPYTLCEIASFQKLDLKQVQESVVASAWKIKAAKIQQEAGADASNRNELQLCIGRDCE